MSATVVTSSGLVEFLQYLVVTLHKSYQSFAVVLDSLLYWP